MWLQEITAYWIFICLGLLVKLRFCNGDGVLEEAHIIICCMK